MAKPLKEFILLPVCFAFAFWLWASLVNDRPLKAQGFYAIQNSSTTSAQSLIVSTAPAFFYAASCTGSSTSTLGFCMIFDQATVPADGAVNPKLCSAVAPGNATGGAAPTTNITTNLPIPFQNGIVAVFSTGANCATKTTSAFVVQLQVNYN